MLRRGRLVGKREPAGSVLQGLSLEPFASLAGWRATASSPSRRAADSDNLFLKIRNRGMETFSAVAGRTFFGRNTERGGQNTRYFLGKADGQFDDRQ
jgi:hypothetical protein